MGLIHLENLEQCQDEWRRKTEARVNQETLMDPPRLDSPRSLRACALCGIDPATSLESLSLRQHFEQVVSGAPWVDRSVSTSVRAQDALNACEESGILTGSTQQKMQAYSNFLRYEENRRDALMLAQELRRQLIAEEIFERRRRVHVDRGSGLVSSLCELGSESRLEHDVLQVSLRPNGGTLAAEAWPVPPSGGTAMVPMEPKKQAKGKEWQPLERRWLGSPPDENTTVSAAAKGTLTETALEDDHKSMRTAAATVAGTAVEAKEVQILEENAPPAPPISSREQDEVFYYYCANAMVTGRISKCRENSFF
ncbi:hypothetical protein, conserved [Trypanosoma cruzi]|uniref:Dynein heavy chain n=1 Tax=Trypanosoma cruzi (strain CL Brener) TaxID=353153 RepID=Q4DPU9_TRYCC|nr:hypothetical protein, conserved [Trypanosoma cruzi]EAN94551.1 hypothetical protein, conserved [Trypanosoma cruzi]|eukprot:XP_816402.1 hypothetical protein [Trypanosoma cruzi strain CL Brener]